MNADNVQNYIFNHDLSQQISSYKSLNRRNVYYSDLTTGLFESVDFKFRN